MSSCTLGFEHSGVGISKDGWVGFTRLDQEES